MDILASWVSSSGGSALPLVAVVVVVGIGLFIASMMGGDD